MRRAEGTRRWAADETGGDDRFPTAAGLRALAEAVMAAMAGREPAVAGGAYGSEGSRVDVLGPPTLGSGGGSSDVHPPSDGPVDGEHAEVWQLVERAQVGDGDAFGRIYDRYYDMVFRYVLFRVRDHGLAEDFTQETFVRALRRITSLSYQGRDIGAWFVTIARNIILDHIKSARNRLETPVADTVEPREWAPSTEAAVLVKLDTETLMGAVDRLGDEQRECILLRFIQGFSVAETAEVMKRNEGAVKALQHRAVKKLADLLGDALA